MDNIVKVLKLDDDNHTPCYVTISEYYHDADNFIGRLLAQPHNTYFKIREVLLVEAEWPDEDEFIHIFDTVACEYDPMKLFNTDKERWLERKENFDKLWEIGEDIWSKQF